MTAPLALLLLLAAPHLAGGPSAEACGSCHGDLAVALSRGVHGAIALSCTACHGGVADAVEVERAHGEGFRSLRDAAQAVELCGGCHSDPVRMRASGLRTDVLALYRSSHHGAALAQGAADTATCTSCHGAHGVLPALDPRSPTNRAAQADTCGRCHADPARMEPHGLSTAVVGEFRDSVHGRAIRRGGPLSGPACADCHGAHGATPPTVDEVGEVCGQCHTLARRYFEEGPHAAPARTGALQECVSCHGSHGVQEPSSAMLLGAEAGHCGSCHAGDAAARDAAEAMHAGLARLDERIRGAERTLAGAAAEGLFLESEHGYLDEARSLRLRAGPLTHALSAELLGDLVNRGEAMVAQTLESLAVKHRALRDRRIFTAAYFVVIAMLVAVLLLYRRETYGRPGRPRGRP